jgi:uncharacterized damage-inducible protein DinB
MMMTNNENTRLPEPWLRGDLQDVRAVPRAVLHALELAEEDLRRWCGGLSDEEMNAAPFGVAPVAFHLRHIARSLDRLLTYAEGKSLTDLQLAALKSETDSDAKGNDLFPELEESIRHSVARIRAIDPNSLEEARAVGKRKLPTSVAGLLIHVADHTQRHVGQAITTAKIIKAQSNRG